MRKISCCKYNKDYKNFSEKLQERLKGKSVITDNECIGACNLCGYKYIVRVDGKLIENEDLELEFNLIENEIGDIG